MRDRAGIIRWLFILSRRYTAESLRARKARRLGDAFRAEAYAECLYQAGIALQMGREITMPGATTLPSPQENADDAG